MTYASSGNTAPHHALAEHCQALREALERNAWEEAETIAKKLPLLIEADRRASSEPSVDAKERRTALLAAQEALNEARTHLDPAYQSLCKLLTAWNVLPPDPR
ncbi:hypothetical protein [Hydrogenophilus thermoluteolus]|uniref:Flagellar protein FliT n=1 Tax=Hydrogenophilus thermoluteolus TaxID=297 RepID=A0A2Z6DZ06_HYDTE|nr:hypothetical protein [Hydrogenophilus thermoluteolus]BBD77751.1 hypothetical protein HPTL_1489 [Hydrogenophilus thermoluteolus]